MAIYTLEELLKKTGTSSTDIKSVTTDIETKSQDSVWENIANSFKKSASNIVASADERAQGIIDRQQQGQGVASTVLQGLGAVAGTAGDVIGETVNLATGGVIPKIIQKGAELVPDFVANAGADVIESYQTWKNSNAEAAANLESTLNIASLVPVPKIAASGINAGLRGVETATDIGTSAIRTAADVAAPIVNTGKNIARGIGDAAAVGIDAVRTVPGRVATNVTERRAIMNSIEQLPTDVAKSAARNGVDIADVKTITKIPEQLKSKVNDLFTAVKNFASGESNVSPIEVIGRPISDRIKTLDARRNVIGKQLGEVADTLGGISKDEIIAPVFEKLQKVPGLQGIKITGSKLDFTDTVLATEMTKSDRAAIQKVFKDAITNGTGKQKHLLRQELFEVIGGKKRGLETITDTQEKAFNAIREGLSDVLESKNAKYSDLSNRYRKIITPLNDMRALIGEVGDKKDLVDLSAGLIARRITSNAKSNPEIRNLLRQLDRATAKGQTATSVETLVDIYNVLEKYYDTSGKTTLQSQVQRGVEKAGVRNLVEDTIGGLVGQTDAVRQKAIEDLIKSIVGK